MPSLRTLFRPSKPRSKSAQPRSHPSWPRLRRIHSATVPLNRQTECLALAEDVKTRDSDNTSARQESVDKIDVQHESTIPDESESARKSNDASSLSRSQHGSKRLKNIIIRFRSSKPQDRSSVSEALPHVEPRDAQDPATTTDPIKQDVPSRTPSTTHRDGQEQQRNVSSQTAISQESAHSTVTVCRHPSQRIQTPIQELHTDWLSDLLDFDKNSAHLPESSDPFSDGKNAELQHTALASSKYSEDQEPEQPRPNSTHSQTGKAKNPSCKSQGSTRDEVAQKGSRTSSGSSHASRGSRISRLDPSKATKAFNLLAKKSGLQLSINTEGPSIGHSGNKDASEDSEPRRRTRFITRVRPVQSTMTLGEASQPPISKLRRTKTFASLTRRPDPMRALRGRTLETLSRLGGHSFLMLPADLAPAPLQLPACLVATMQYLRKYGSGVSELFSEPGDIKAATRLYDHFASQVLSAEKEEPKIAMTMRIIAMPSLEDSDPATVLSVGWVLKALLTGLPDGILGSDRLYQVLSGIFRADIEIWVRIRLLTLAIVALTSEIQCALICAVFALLTVLLPVVNSSSSSTNPDPEQLGGNPVRPVGNRLDPDRALQIFGPLLLGTSPDRDSAVQQNVQREVDEGRVVELVLKHWRAISRQLREWASL